MNAKRLIPAFVVLLIALTVIPAAAQTATPVLAAPLRIEIQAADGVTLVGDFYNAELNIQTPAVLLMHMVGGWRSDWQPLIPVLTRAGYRVLAVDLRGHGESQGTRDWGAAVGDTQAWLGWMHSQPAIQPDRVAIVGASIGANLALVGCADDPQCRTAVALSPGLNYYDVTPGDALINSYGERGVLLVGSRSDRPSGADVQALAALGRGEVGVQLYAGSVHGTGLLRSQANSVIPLVVNWLDIHLR
jgi:pimeloyl-ACP methyl ester carboxylesterase